VALLLAAALLGAWALPSAGMALVITRPLAGKPDVIVSLASHEWERLPATARMASLFPQAVVLLTEPDVVTPFNCHDCANRVHRLWLAGVKKERVEVVPLTRRGTYGEAQAVRQWASRHHVERLLVVTSPYHTRRSLAVFRAALDSAHIDVGVEPALAFSPASPERWWAAPYDRAYVAYEWTAIVYYALRYPTGGV
jgi:uncharacterized SAM-binding protein YcdF (DUF218 family)